ncbi:MAG: UDP-N-acetylmuramate dehydrogenase [Pseudomonadota bacterium]
MNKLRAEFDRQLSDLNTLGLPAVAECFFDTTTDSDLESALQQCATKGDSPLILGGGSNIVFSGKPIPRCIRIASQGIRTISKESDRITLAVSSGVNWNGLVDYCIKSGYFGLENLALIPGSVGAAPVQNIGAYGVELDQFVERVHFRWIENGARQSYSAEQCEFGYRDSVFKRQLHGKVVITEVEFSLLLQSQVNIEYEALRQELGELSQPSAAQVRNAVVAIRRRKLPDPQQLPNAGSFFKNPIVSKQQMQGLLEHFSNVAYYPTESSDQFKLAAGWLVDQAGWRGYREQHVGVHQEQALVLVNHDKANGTELLELATRIQRSVYAKFAVELEIEPRIY